MYRPVAINDDDKRFRLILYRKRLTDPIQKYCLNTVNYGPTPAPFLEEFLKIQEEIVTILNDGGFSLAKWHSNHPNLLENVEGKNRWRRTKPALLTCLELLGIRKRKRVSSRIFDPLGLSSYCER